MWKRADEESPNHKPDTWSEEMICLTSHGNVYKLTFMGGWQRPAAFLPGEVVDWWIENPQKTRSKVSAMSSLEFLIAPNGENRIRFINKSTGETEDPLSVLGLAARGKCRVVREGRTVELTTALKVFGAPEDGVLTVVGQEERDVKFTLVIEI